MGYKIKVTSAATAGKIFVPGLGAFVPNEWADVSDADAQLYESIRGKKLESSGSIEVKKAATPKKKESE